MSNDDNADALKSIMDSLAGEPGAVPRSRLQWILDHIPEDMNEEDAQAWVFARMEELMSEVALLRAKVHEKKN